MPIIYEHVQRSPVVWDVINNNSCWSLNTVNMVERYIYETFKRTTFRITSAFLTCHHYLAMVAWNQWLRDGEQRTCVRCQ
jgi:hypothetical protein